MSIETYEPTTIEAHGRGMPAWVGLLAPAVHLAEVLAPTEFVPKQLRGRPEAIAAAIMYGAEVGIGPMQALASIAIVDGRPAPSAELLRALVFASGGEIWVEDSSGTRVTVAGRRVGSPNTVTVTWTMEQARAANLAGKQNWRQYPRQMLTARATAELARLLWPDVVKGLSSDDGQIDITDAPPDSSGDATGSAPGVTTMRRRRRASGAAEPMEQTPEVRPLSPQTDDVPEPPAPITDEQLTRLSITLRELFGDDRAAKLRLVSSLIGREIASSTELTKADASVAIDKADAILAGVEPFPDEPEPEPQP